MSYPSCSLSELASIYSGFAFKSKDLVENGIPVIKIANIQNKQVIKECADCLPEDLFAPKLEKYLLKKDDVLIAMTGAGSVGKVGKMRNVDRSYLVNQRVAIVRPYSYKSSVPEFIYQVLSLDYYEKKLYGLGLGAGQPNVSAEMIGSLEIPLPDFDTQQKIASILSSYDDLIENNTKRIKILEEMAQTIYNEWFVKFRFQGHENVKIVESELGMIPEGWEVQNIEDVYDTSSGGTPSRKVSEYYDGHINWVKTKELNDSYIFDTEEKITQLGLDKSSAKVFPENTVIMAMYGATIGKLGILTSPSATNQACCAILTKDDTYNHLYAYLYLLTNRTEIISLGMGAAQQNISQQVIKKLRILVPPKDIVSRFNLLVFQMFESLKLLSLKNINLRKTRDLLLPRLISGDIDVSELDIDVGGITA